MNLGEEQLLTVGVFTNAAPPDPTLMAYNMGAGIVKHMMSDTSLLTELIGKSDDSAVNGPGEGLLPRGSGAKISI